MADRYWVGGSGTWNASSTANWAASSGGASGASAPTSADNAYFDGSSDTGAPFTVTIGTGAVCADVIIGNGTTVSVLDQTMTLAGTADWFIYGSLFFPSTNLTITFSASCVFEATSGSYTITTNGVSLPNLNFGSSAVIPSTATYTLGSNLTTSGNVLLRRGTLSTSNYNITASAISFNGPNGKTLNLGSSTITLSSTAPVSFTSGGATGTTINSGTSTINLAATAPSFCFGIDSSLGFTWYNVNFTSTALTTSAISGIQAFNNLTLAPRAAAGIGTLLLGGNQVITGTLHVQSGLGATFNITNTAGAITSAVVNAGGEGYNVGDVLSVSGGNGNAQLTVATLSGTAIATVTITAPGTGYSNVTGATTTLFSSTLNPNRRLFIASDTLGTPRIINANNINMTGVDFRDITAAGNGTQIYGGSWTDASRSRSWSNVRGNSGITFSANTIVFRVGPGGGQSSWSNTQLWSNTSGGTANTRWFPLTQDTSIFDSNTPGGGVGFDALYNFGNIDCQNVISSNSQIFNFTGANYVVYGDLLFNANVFLGDSGTSAPNTLTIAGSGTQRIRSVNTTHRQPIIINSSGTVQLLDPFTMRENYGLTLSNGTIDVTNTTITTGSFSATATTNSTKAINFGTTGKIVVDGWGSPLVDLSNSGSVANGVLMIGTPVFEFTNKNANLNKGFRNIFSPAVTDPVVTRTRSPNLVVSTNGLFIFTGSVRTVDATGVGANSVFGIGGTSYITGNITIPSNLSWTWPSPTGALTFIDTAQISANGVLLNFPITIDANANTVQLSSNVSTAYATTLTSGTLNLDGRTLTSTSFNGSGSTARTLALGSNGVMSLTGSGTAFNIATRTNLTVTGTGRVSFTNPAFTYQTSNTYPVFIRPRAGNLTLTVSGTVANADLRSVSSANVGSSYSPSSGYFATLLTAPNNEPRFEYNPVTRESLGLEIEPDVTNLLTWSEQFDNAAWIKDGTVSVTANVDFAPDGSFTADLLSGATGSGTGTTVTNKLYRGTNTASGFNQNNTLSVWVKAPSANAATTVRIMAYDNNTNSTEGQDFTVTSSWRRISYTRSASTQGLRFQIGGTNGSVLIWGAQQEAGSIASSYVKSESASVSKRRDRARMTGNNFLSFYNQEEGTFVIETIPYSTSTGTLLNISANNSLNGIVLQANASPLVITTGGTSTTVTNATIQSNLLNRIAFAYLRNGNSAISINGTNATETTANLSSATANTLDIGNNLDGSSSYLTGTIRRIIYFSKRLPNDQLRVLSSVER